MAAGQAFSSFSLTYDRGNAMIVYLSMTTAVILLSIFSLSKRERDILCCPAQNGMASRKALVSTVSTAGIFTALFLVQAFRINVGNDYAKYVEFMHLARFGSYVPTEPGFNFLAWLTFRLFGYENFLFCFAVMALITVAGFLFAIDRLSVSFFPGFLMFITLGYYFQSINTVRYYLALALAACSIYYLLKRDIPRFLLLVVIAACFHKSALIVLLFYPAAMMVYKRWHLAILVCTGALGLILRPQVLSVMLALYPTYKETGLAAGGEGSLMSIARCAAVLVLAIILDRGSILGNRSGEDDDISRRFYCHCNLLALFLYVFFYYLPVVSRIGYYLTFTHILYIPALVSRMEPGPKKRIATGAVLVVCAVFFLHTMMHAGDDGFRILPYQTFFFHKMPPILSDTGY